MYRRSGFPPVALPFKPGLISWIQGVSDLTGDASLGLTCCWIDSCTRGIPVCRVARMQMELGEKAWTTQERDAWQPEPQVEQPSGGPPPYLASRWPQTIRRKSTPCAVSKPAAFSEEKRLTTKVERGLPVSC